MAKVKICGITNVRDAKAALAVGADYLGLNFYKRSKRHITPAAAKKIAQAVQKTGSKAKLVGVFVNETPERVAQISKAVGLHYAQLHGDETSAEVAQLAKSGVPVIKALRVGPNFRAGAQLSEHKRAKAILLDGFDPRERGGTGKTFDWHKAAKITGTKPLFLAGGLTPENVAEAIRIAQPYAVDVCSGVESAASPRKKDPAKIAALLKAVHSATQHRPRSKRN
jgi:phosphoribosylanthranilate isomerase